MPTLIAQEDNIPPNIIQKQEIIILSRLPNQTFIYLLARLPKKPPIANAPTVYPL